MNLELDDKVVLVTGGSRGIGRALVQTFRDEGARVLSVDRDASPDESSQVHSCRGDLSDPATCRRAVDQALSKFGSLAVLVNNAGRNDGVGLTAGPAAFLDSLRNNLLHYYTMAHYAQPHLEQARGAIINIGSKVAVTGQGGTSGYAAAKGGVLALTREWALELAPKSVRVNAVLPAEVWTPLYESWLAAQPDAAIQKQRIESSVPLGGRFTTAEEIANTVAFLASARSSHTTGQVVFVDGGYTHLDCSGWMGCTPTSSAAVAWSGASTSRSRMRMLRCWCVAFVTVCAASCVRWGSGQRMGMQAMRMWRAVAMLASSCCLSWMLQRCRAWRCLENALVSVMFVSAVARAMSRS
jgi:L-fucose dehydrogenase